MSRPFPPPPPPQRSYRTPDERIAEALGRIADAVEKLKEHYFMQHPMVTMHYDSRHMCQYDLDKGTCIHCGRKFNEQGK